MERVLRQGKRLSQLVERWSQEQQRIRLYCQDSLLEVQVVSASILRFRFSPEGQLEDDFSYAVLPQSAASPPAFEFREAGDEFHLDTPQLRCVISRSLHIQLRDSSGHVISQDERGFYAEPHEQYGGNIVYCRKKIMGQECFFGLGDKPERFNMRGLRFENWGSDMYGFERTTDPLYKNIPFFVGLHHGIAYGIFFDNSFRTRFDFGHERSDICTFWAKGGEMNYYFIYGPEMLSVVERYTLLTGVPELPPLWALGYHQSKWSYFPEAKVLELAQQFRKLRIPCDVIHLDIDHMDGFRCFTWDSKRFSDPRRLRAELEADGFKTVTILDPGIKIDKDYAVYQEGIAGGHFCKRADGPLMQGDGWPGLCHFPDYTHPETRAWWSKRVQDFAKDWGVHGIWNDMNEPAILDRRTFPPDTRHDYDGHPCSHRKAHNVYGMQMARASWEGIKKARFPHRPFNLSRSGYAGLQRYAATWTGDNLATWGHLWMANIQCQRLSFSGLSFCGSDIGGFIGDCSGELFVRWMQMAALHPFCRTHYSGDHADQEPWSFGEPYTSAARKALELRYRLLPYLYTCFWQYVTYGAPILRPLVLHDQQDPETHYRMEEFSLGEYLFACPISSPGAKGRQMYLPKGLWYNFWNDAPQAGGKEFWAEASLDQMPLWVKAGATIPFYPAMQYVGEALIETLDLHVYYGEGPCTSELYEDAGDFYDYEQGNSMVRTFTQIGKGNSLSIKQLRKGRFNSDYTRLRFLLHGLPFVPEACVADGEKVRIRKQNGGGAAVYVIEAEKNFEEIYLSGAARKGEAGGA